MTIEEFKEYLSREIIRCESQAGPASKNLAYWQGRVDSLESVKQVASTLINNQ